MPVTHDGNVKIDAHLHEHSVVLEVVSGDSANRGAECTAATICVTMFNLPLLFTNYGNVRRGFGNMDGNGSVVGKCFLDELVQDVLVVIVCLVLCLPFLVCTGMVTNYAVNIHLLELVLQVLESTYDELEVVNKELSERASVSLFEFVMDVAREKVTKHENVKGSALVVTGHFKSLFKEFEMTGLGNIWIVLVNSMGACTWNNFAIVGIRDGKNEVVITVVSLLDIDVELVVFDFGKLCFQRISQLGCNV